MAIKNVIYICNYAAEYPGNFISSLVLLSKKVIEQNKEVYYIFPEMAKNKEWLKLLPVDKKNIIFIDFNAKGLDFKLKELKKILKPKETIIHTHFVDGVILFKLKKHYLRKNIIIHFHNTMKEEKNIIISIIKRIIRNFAYMGLKIVAVSPTYLPKVQKYYFLNKDIDMITNAIDFESLELRSEDIDIDLNLDPRNYNMLIFGSAFYRKSVDIAIQAINKVNDINEKNKNKIYNKYKLYITSDKIEETKKLVLKHSENTEDLGDIFEVIPIVTNVGALYKKMNLFLSVSRRETFAYAVLEASLTNSKCQIIASDIIGQDTLKIIDGINWVELENVEQLTKKIIEVSKRKIEELENLKEKQIQSAKEGFDIKNWVISNLKLYNNIESRI